MGESTRMIDVEKLISYSDDLVEVLRDRRDITNATQCLKHFTISARIATLISKKFIDCFKVSFLSTSLQYEEKIEACKKKTELSKSEVVDCAEMDSAEGIPRGI
ncbi:putative GRAS family transcription factor [Hibiscus syriacus]|uniref:GRAS family transcription factor n=1 Tax=Hibiscus syriacus TaxID=106335 RepID=A0A6A3AJV7_HIBSY|nr:putative GRAS family transcription factor [Hibiscus syriacus]